MEGQGENEELYPIAVLIDELKVRLPVVRFSSRRDNELTLHTCSTTMYSCV